MTRTTDPKTQTLYVYVTPKNKAYVKDMRQIMGSESNYIELLINIDRRKHRIKRFMLRKLNKEIREGSEE